MRLGNPFAFRPGPVSFWTSLVYLIIILSLVYVHETVPPAPSQRDLPEGVNLTEAWSDLQAITRQHHPYNSHANDVVRDYLLRRLREILDRNGVKHTTETTGGIPWSHRFLAFESETLDTPQVTSSPEPGATIFDDTISNVTYTLRDSPVGQYFEGSNLYVYIHGTEDPGGDWWRSGEVGLLARRGSGVLVNCHFDSVSTAYGATDNGVSCVSMLQLLNYFTAKGRQPRNGIVLLFNNAEEDGLLGARAFGYSPLVQFCHAFVNLEGTGAGGRALLFRTTDLETAQAYTQSPHPFGSVVAANAFERGVIRSATDYSVFVDGFGSRGLDIAFYGPRSRYHTDEDDARHTSTDSIWHMFSAALATTKSLAASADSLFSGPRSDGRKDLIQNGRPTAGVWFDWLGSAWSAFTLRGLFAWTLTLLITTPLVLFLFAFILMRYDKWYFFAGRVSPDRDGAGRRISIGGWKGFVRFPLALAAAGGLTIGAVFLLAKVNPLIIYSSSYAVWAMMFSLFYFASWLLLRGAHFVRPSALQRGFSLLWVFLMVWVLSIFAAVAEDRMNLGGVYPLAFLHSFAFGAVLISLLEQFGLPSKRKFAEQLASTMDDDSDSADEGSHGDDGGDTDDESEPTETTPLRAGEDGGGVNETTTFASTYRRSATRREEASAKSTRRRAPYEHEQDWSGWLPSWLWLFQFLLLGPVYIIVLGNLALVQTTALSMTGTDGSSPLTPLMGIGVLTIMLLLPLVPFIHRVSHHVPLLMLVVFAATLVYNLVAFPFSANHRFKFFFQQVVDLDDQTNTVSLMGVESFLRPVIGSLPTPAGQHIKCADSGVRADLSSCQYDASLLRPDVANGTRLEDVVTIEASGAEDGRVVTVRLDAPNTRTCFLDSSVPIWGFAVEGGGTRDERFGSFPPDGLGHVQLWRRKWEGAWVVTLQLGGRGRPAAGGGEAKDGQGRPDKERRDAGHVSITARCAWSDINDPTTLPAFQEVRQFMPTWSIVTKASVGLLEVKKTVRVSM